MSELKAHAGNGPADPSANGGSPRDVIVQDMLPASVNLREELAECRSLMAECARLASASAQAAGAIARLCDSETKRRLAIARMDVLPNPPPRRLSPLRRASLSPSNPAPPVCAAMASPQQRKISSACACSIAASIATCAAAPYSMAIARPGAAETI